MARIKVTGFIETDDLDEDEVDLNDSTGLSESAYLSYASGGATLPSLEDLEFTLEP